MILIDNLIKNSKTQSSFNVVIDGEKLNGYQIAKPLNYSHLTLNERWKMSKLIMDGKAIAVQYFEDLTKEEQENYIKNEIIKTGINKLK